MMKKLTSHGVCVMVWLMTILGSAAVAWAQSTPDSPSLRRTPPQWWGYAILFLLLVVVVAVSLMPSKRSHQD